MPSTEELLTQYRDAKKRRRRVLAASNGKYHPSRARAHYVGNDVRTLRRLLMMRGIDPSTGESPYAAYDDLQGGANE